MAWKGLINEFEKYLPVNADTTMVTLLEGNTPLIASRNLSREGVLCEPASAASLAGVLKLHKRGFFKEGDQVVCILTGNGLKGPDCAMRGITAPVSLKADKDIVARHISAAWSN